MARRPIRVGVVGVGRGLSMGGSNTASGLELVALCDTWQERLLRAGERLGGDDHLPHRQWCRVEVVARISARSRQLRSHPRQPGSHGRRPSTPPIFPSITSARHKPATGVVNG